MSNIKDLKAIADEHGIEYKSNYNKEKMIKVLAEHDIHVGESVEVEEVERPVSKVYANFDHKLRELQMMKQSATSEIDLKKLEAARLMLREDIDKNGTEKDLQKLLNWERRYKFISVADSYLLNKMEADKAPGRLVCTSEPAPGLHASVGGEYRFTKQFDASRGVDMYNLYIHRTIEPQEQITKELAWDIQNGYKPEKKDYPDRKTVWHMFPLVEKEVLRYFKITEDVDVQI